MLDAGGRGLWSLEGRAIGYGSRVEDGDVGIGAGGEHAAAGQPEPGGRQGSHAAGGLLEGKEAAIAARSRPPCSGALFDQVTSTFSALSACAALSTVEEAM